ncbi:hypothetical protein PGB90_006200 [Kerria lacca]
MNRFYNIKNLVLIKKATFLRNTSFISRQISISSKSPEGTTVTVEHMPKTQIKLKKKNWVSYGFDYVDQRTDIMYLHTTSFFLITIFFWGIIFVLSYYPDLDDLDWSNREAYIQLRRREVLGLPLVDKDYARPEDIPLPPDEEIGDDEIII